MPVVSMYVCSSCDVGGSDPAEEPACWSCGGPVTVTARISSRPPVRIGGWPR